MDQIKDVLAVNIIGTLATLNEDGSPWATPVHIVAGEGVIYWFSKDTHQHSLNVENDSRVSVSLWSNDGRSKGVYISGDASKLDGAAAQEAFSAVIAKFGSIPPIFDGVSVYSVPVGALNKDKSSENRWYFYTNNR